ncbi:MAG: 3-demethylubiquinone-9 3-methyltransferase protein [uncultured bacterium]|nr:MAG: 3-demethylubiquinone-9 3-methyltransferase protein [uncultured bacterium]
MDVFKVENGIIVGNSYPADVQENPIARMLLNNFYKTLKTLLSSISFSSIHEVGCGEGLILDHLKDFGVPVFGSDISRSVLDECSRNLGNPAGITLVQSDIYELDTEKYSADLVVFCEVLEHLPRVGDALEIVRKLSKEYAVISVPHEPLWRALNLLRFKYVRGLGNTPGHIQHWTPKAFINLVSKYFTVVSIRKPTPWIILLCKKRDS